MLLIQGPPGTRKTEVALRTAVEEAERLSVEEQAGRVAAEEAD